MTTPTRFLALILACVLVAPAVAEVAVDSPGGYMQTIVMGAITEGPDPIGQVAWEPIRPLPALQVLNPSGFTRGDGGPSFGWRSNGWPVVVWAYNVGPDFDVALSEWDGSSWTSTAFLTSSVANEEDPRVFVEADGTTHVVWWKEGTPSRIFLATRPSGATAWDPTVTVSPAGDQARRPSVVVSGGTLRIAYERDSAQPGMVRDVVVLEREAGGSFTEEFFVSTDRIDRLDPVLHAQDSYLWLDWKHDSDDFGCAQHDGSSWSSDAMQPWSDPSWIGVEEARRAVRDAVIP